MLASLVKVLDGEFHEGELKLSLTVEFVRGLPREGDGIFSPESFCNYFYIIEKINKQVSYKTYELTLDYHEPEWIWEKRWKKNIKEGDDIALCGLTVENYQSLTIKQKIEYFSLLADFVGVGRVPEFIKSHIGTNIKLRPIGSEGMAGLTKFGGLPIAPGGFAFPKDEKGKSALFIGQIYMES